MTENIDWKQVARHIATLYEASESLNAMFPGDLPPEIGTSWKWSGQRIGNPTQQEAVR